MSPAVLAHQLTHIIGARIAHGRYAPGDVVRINELEDEFGVSRTAVREAIKQLESLGMVTSRRHVGIAVTDPKTWSMLSVEVLSWKLDGPDRRETLSIINELRLGMEPVAAMLAATRAKPTDCEQLICEANALTQAAEAGDLGSYLEHDIAFHSLILTASSNPVFASLSQAIANALPHRTLEANPPPPLPGPSVVARHHLLASAIAAGDEELARAHAERIIADAFASLAQLNASTEVSATPQH